MKSTTPTRILQDEADVKEAPDIWGGIRVRVGMDYGFASVRLDPMSQGYDYYGNIVNTAARVEGVGHGGQTLITNNVRAVTNVTEGIIYIELGEQHLRGLTDAVVLIRLLPQTLASRTFPALRLDVEVVVDDTTTATGTDSQVQASTNSAKITVLALAERAAQRFHSGQRSAESPLAP